MVERGDQVGDITYPKADGTVGKLSDFNGKPVVVYFYPKDDTPGCTTEAKDFTSLAGDFAAIGVPVLGVSKDTAAKHEKFKTKHALQVELIADVDGALCERFGVWVEKSLYGRAYMGIERATFLIDNAGRVAEVWRKVKVKGHAESVLAGAQALATS
ncbi:MAG: peroxiredoxin [Sphingomonadales bacterium]